MKSKNILRKLGAALIRPFTHRPDTRLKLLQRLPQGSIGAEIGVWKGEFSNLIMKHVQPRELHLIDPWEFLSEYPDRLYGGKVAKQQADMDAILASVKAMFQASPQVRFHRGYSDAVLATFADGYFDWVYVDGNHLYDFVRKDLELGYAKVKPGGLITGDDLDWGEEHGFPVEKAVKDFVREKKIEGQWEKSGTQFIIRR